MAEPPGAEGARWRVARAAGAAAGSRRYRGGGSHEARVGRAGRAGGWGDWVGRGSRGARGEEGRRTRGILSRLWRGLGAVGEGGAGFWAVGRCGSRGRQRDSVAQGRVSKGFYVMIACTQVAMLGRMRGTVLPKYSGVVSVTFVPHIPR